MAHVPEQRLCDRPGASLKPSPIRRWPAYCRPSAENAAAQIGRWAQRHRRWALAISLFMLIAVLGLAARTAIIYRALKSEAQQRSIGRVACARSRRHLYAARLNLALEDWQQGNVARVLELLDREQPAAEQQDLRGFEWHHLRRLCEHASKGVLRGHAHPVLAVAMAADNSVWASADERGAIRVWNPATQALRLTLEAGAKVHGLAISRDGQKLAAACHDQARTCLGSAVRPAVDGALRA